jgi:hypothetical protein
MIDTTRAERFQQLYWSDQEQGLRLLFEWVRTGVINRATFIECTRYIVPDGSGT